MKYGELIIAIITGTLMAIFFTNNNIVIELVTGIPLLIVLIWSIIATQKSNIDSKLKKNSWFALLPIFAIMYRIYIQLLN